MSKGKAMSYHLDDDPAVIALRARIAELEQENAALLENLSLCKGNELAQQLAQMTRERDAARDIAAHAEFDHDHYTLVKQQLAQAHAEIEDWRHKLQRALS